MYKEGDYIHYGSAGLSRIEELTAMKMSETDEERLYYRLCPVKGRGSVIYTPVDNHKVKMRAALTRSEAQSLLDAWPTIDMLQLPIGKHTEEACKAALASLDSYVWAALIRTLTARRERRLAAGRKVTSTEERYLREARERLYTELAFALDTTDSEVESRIKQMPAPAVH